MNLEQLKELVKDGEAATLELKETTGQLGRAMESVCALLNSASGGYVIFGVKDDGHVMGQMVSVRTHENIANELRNIEPAVFPTVETIKVDTQHSVIVVQVPGDRTGLYAYKGSLYIRRGPTDDFMPNQEYKARLMEKFHATRRWENEPADPSITMDDLDAEQIQLTINEAVRLGRLKEPKDQNIEHLLRGLGLIQNNHLLNAAVVLYGNTNKVSTYYPQCSIRMARFRGLDKRASFDDNRQYTGHAFSLLSHAESFLLDHVPIAGEVISGQMRRRDRPWYPPRATREALANAICHRDYTIAGGSVTLAMFNDRIEVANPGRFYLGVTAEQLLGPHESKPWNPLIAGVFYFAGVIEKWGSGTTNIIDWCNEFGMCTPSWREEPDETVKVIFTLQEHALRPESQPGSQPGSQPESQPESLETKVLNLLKYKDLSKSEISQNLGQKAVSGQLNMTIRGLVKEGLIAYTIPDRPMSRLQKYRLTDKGKKHLE